MNQNDDFELDEMTDAEHDQAEVFFENNDFVEAPGVNHSGSNFEHVWEDFKEAEAFEKANSQMHIYTAVGDMDECHVIKGKHHVNRYGYLFSKTDAGLKDGDTLRIR